MSDQIRGFHETGFPLVVTLDDYGHIQIVTP